jgi:hypothetical protein
MFVPFWLFIILSGFGCYGVHVFFRALYNSMFKAVPPPVAPNKLSTPCCPKCGSYLLMNHGCPSDSVVTGEKNGRYS